MTSIKIYKKRLLESVHKIMEQEAEGGGGGGWPSDPPKAMPRTESGGPTADEVVAKFKEFAAMGPPESAEAEMKKIGGEETLKANYEALAKRFKGSAKNPERIKMPVVDPKKGDIGDDGGDLGARMAKGQLDLKAPFAQESVQHIAKMVVESLRQRGLLVEQEPAAQGGGDGGSLDDKFPSDLLGDKERAEKFLTKGDRDGSDTDDSAVTMTKQPIEVGKARPSQKQVYIDKSLWNILNFGGAGKGGTAFGKADMIAIADGGEYIILDGHHRWSSAFLGGGPTAKVNVQVIDGLNTAEAIAALRAYGNARGNKQKA
jgi:hypothetical protein